MKTVLALLSTIAIALLLACTAHTPKMSFDCEPLAWQRNATTTQSDTLWSYKIMPRVLAYRDQDDSSVFILNPSIEYYSDYDLEREYPSDTLSLIINKVKFIVESDTIPSSINDSVETLNRISDKGYKIEIKRIIFSEFKATPLPDSIAFIANVSFQNVNGGITQNISKEFMVCPKLVDIQTPLIDILPNSPSPFSPRTNICYELDIETEVTITIYNIAGQLVDSVIVNEFQEAGYYDIDWYGRDLNGNVVASGIYFWQISTPEFTATHKMVFLK